MYPFYFVDTLSKDDQHNELVLEYDKHRAKQQFELPVLMRYSCQQRCKSVSYVREDKKPFQSFLHYEKWGTMNQSE